MGPISPMNLRTLSISFITIITYLHTHTIIHSKACPPKADDPDSSYCNDFLIKDEDTSEQTASKSASHTRAKIEKRSGKDPLFLSDENGHFVEMDDSEPLASLIKQEEPDPPKTVSNSVTSTYIPTTGTSHHMPKDHQQLDVELAKFFYGCNIPFSVAESDHFKTFIKLLRPSYQPPSPNTLSARLLDTMYADLLYSNAKVIPSETTLLLEMSSLSNIVTMLQTADGMCMYLESFNYANLMGKTGEALAKACEKARELAKERHNADIFAVVSAHSRDIADRSKSNLWHCVCSTYEGNLLANELNEQRVLNKLTKIVAEFKSNEKLLIDSGGTRILMADNGRSLSAFDSMNSLLENLTYMRDLANETNEVKACAVNFTLCNLCTHFFFVFCFRFPTKLQRFCLTKISFRWFAIMFGASIPLRNSSKSARPPTIRLLIQPKIGLNCVSMTASWMPKCKQPSEIIGTVQLVFTA